MKERTRLLLEKIQELFFWKTLRGDMKSQSQYVLQLDEKTFCPKCGITAYLLCPEVSVDVVSPGRAMSMPWFYVCFGCRVVAEIGRGPVPYVSTRESGDAVGKVQGGPDTVTP